VTGTLPNGVSKIVTFTLLVKKICDIATVANPADITPIDYTITGTELKFTLPVMTASNGICTIDYSITNQDGSTLNPFLIKNFAASNMEIGI
jgi:hypothetical protein